MPEDDWGFLFKSEQLRLYALRFDNFKPRLKTGTFKCIFWLKGSFLFFVGEVLMKVF
jgi:hypothetical protein